ncbi:ciliary microtubule associated protein 1A [Halyomorpha halys]|uniref:ciliary microtubule associated protein 1A n=1 Tax=Halyomorpha halys TaxID=286706 RepID=UPI0006D4F5DE|nr:uncharacterized protein LOC106684027 [Halyomorpha halys]
MSISLSDISSLDLSLTSIDFDDDWDDPPEEPHPLTIIKKKKMKKKRGKRKRKRRRRMREFFLKLPPEHFAIIDQPPVFQEVSTPIIKEISDEEEEEDPLLRVKDLGPEPVGIVGLLMKRRRERAIEERRPSPRPRSASDEEEKSVVTDEEESVIVVQTVKPKPPPYISCKFITPGPGHYEYRPSFGYVGHDPTRKRAPGFSFGRRLTIPKKRFGPGPKYNLRNFTPEGKEKPIAHSFGIKRPLPAKEPSPGPADYIDQTLYLAKKSPRATIYGRRENQKVLETPVAIGELSFMGNSKPAACLIGRPKAPKPNHFPSPLSYAPVKPDVFLKRGPSITMGYNRKPPKKDADYFPTVGTYHPNYDYMAKKRNIVIPSSDIQKNCIRVPLDLPAKKEDKK